jgi:hypothetical protein
LAIESESNLNGRLAGAVCEWVSKLRRNRQWRLRSAEKSGKVATKPVAKVGKKTEQLFDRILPIPVNL